VPKYDVSAGVYLTVEARDARRARSAVKEAMKDYWWRETTIGFSQSRFKVEIDKVKVLHIERKQDGKG